MKEDFVSYELAVKLKEKGYPQSVAGKYSMRGACYFEDGRFYEDGCIANVEDCFSAPMIHQVLKWLREEKKIYVALDFFRFNGNTEIWWTYSVRYIEDDSTENIFESCKRKSWEQAALAGIEYVIDNLI